MINEGLHTNFYEMVNHKRIELAQEKLCHCNEGVEPKILDVAYEVGFNSKSAFNQAFKKYVGLTPSEFRELQHKKAH